MKILNSFEWKLITINEFGFLDVFAHLLMEFSEKLQTSFKLHSLIISVSLLSKQKYDVVSETCSVTSLSSSCLFQKFVAQKPSVFIPNFEHVANF